VYYTIIKAPQKRGHFQAIDRVNQAIQQEIGNSGYTIDLNECLCEESNDILGLYQEDQLHLTPQAYQTVESYNRTRFWDPFLLRHSETSV
jgi:hypothetical protein